jgi:hypothetical protein
MMTRVLFGLCVALLCCAGIANAKEALLTDRGRTVFLQGEEIEVTLVTDGPAGNRAVTLHPAATGHPTRTLPPLRVPGGADVRVTGICLSPSFTVRLQPGQYTLRIGQAAFPFTLASADRPRATLMEQQYGQGHLDTGMADQVLGLQGINQVFTNWNGLFGGNATPYLPLTLRGDAQPTGPTDGIDAVMQCYLQHGTTVLTQVFNTDAPPMVLVDDVNRAQQVRLYQLAAQRLRPWPNWIGFNYNLWWQNALQETSFPPKIAAQKRQELWKAFQQDTGVTGDMPTSWTYFFPAGGALVPPNANWTPAQRDTWLRFAAWYRGRVATWYGALEKSLTPITPHIVRTDAKALAGMAKGAPNLYNAQWTYHGGLLGPKQGIQGLNAVFTFTSYELYTWLPHRLAGGLLWHAGGAWPMWDAGIGIDQVAQNDMWRITVTDLAGGMQPVWVYYPTPRYQSSGVDWTQQNWGRGIVTQQIDQFMRQWGPSMLQATPPRDPAILVSFRSGAAHWPDGRVYDQVGAPGPEPGNQMYGMQLMDAWASTMFARTPADFLYEEDLANSTTLQGRKTILIVGQVVPLLPDAEKALRQFIAGGGRVLIDRDSTITLPGAQKLDMGFTDIQRLQNPNKFHELFSVWAPYGGRNWGDTRDWDWIGAPEVQAKITALRAILLGGQAPPADCADPRVMLVTRQVDPQTVYLFVIDLKRPPAEFGGMAKARRHLTWQALAWPQPRTVTVKLDGSYSGRSVFTAAPLTSVSEITAPLDGVQVYCLRRGATPPARPASAMLALTAPPLPAPASLGTLVQPAPQVRLWDERALAQVLHARTPVICYLDAGQETLRPEVARLKKLFAGGLDIRPLPTSLSGYLLNHANRYDLPYPPTPDGLDAPLLLVGTPGANHLLDEINRQQLLPRLMTTYYPGPGRAMACHLWSPFAPGRHVIALCAGDTAGLRAGIAALLARKWTAPGADPAQSWLELPRHLMLPTDVKQALGQPLPLPPGARYQPGASPWQESFTLTVPFVAAGNAGDWQVSGYPDGRVRWGKPGQPAREVHLPNAWWVHQVGITADGQRIIAGANMDGNVFVLDGSKADAPVLWQTRVNVPMNTEVEPDHFAFDANAGRLYVNQLDPPSITAYAVGDMRQVWQLPLPAPAKAALMPMRLALSGDGKTLALTYRVSPQGDAGADTKKLADAHLTVLDATTGVVIGEGRQADIWVATDFADACVINFDGTVIACASGAADLYLFDRAGKLVTQFTQVGPLSGAGATTGSYAGLAINPAGTKVWYFPRAGTDNTVLTEVQVPEEAVTHRRYAQPIQSVEGGADGPKVTLWPAAAALGQ